MVKKSTSRGGPQTPPEPRSVAVGTGLVALDVVISQVSGMPPRYWAGGTCGNVMAALAYLGWESLPVGRLRPGSAAERIRQDLGSWGVSDRFLECEDGGSTPVIVERITRSGNGTPRHSFSWRCPTCGTSFPPYKPVLQSAAERIAKQLDRPQVFFFDRVSPGALLLARACAERGSVVFFEPSGVGNAILFRQAWDVAHVVKYSHERLSELPEIGVHDGPVLLIETLGEAGLRFCNRLANRRSPGWEESPGYPVATLRDAAGAGDWCTAGFLSQVATSGLTGLLRATPQAVRRALRYGQALAAWNCGFEGARGGMYAVTGPEFRRQVAEIFDEESDLSLSALPTPQAQLPGCESLCPACSPPEADQGSASTA